MRALKFNRHTGSSETGYKPFLAFGCAILSGLLLFSSFPPVNAGDLAYIALIPLVCALRIRPESSCRLGYTAGLTFWWPSLWFLSPVTVTGTLFLGAYCALYWVPLAWIWGSFLKKWRPAKSWTALRMVFGGAGLWCVMEHLRGWMLTGFPWNQLGVSQWQNYSLIQTASFGGVLFVSFILVSMNLGIALSCISLFRSMGNRQPRRMHPELYLPILLLAVSFSWGSRQLRQENARIKGILQVGIVQPLAENKWSEAAAVENFRVLYELSREVLSEQPDLVIWPETSVPEMYRSSLAAQQMVSALLDEGIPLLIGSLEAETAPGTLPVETLYYNSSFLVGPDGEIRSTYRKKHLVMFGEYIPFSKLFPFLRSLTPMPDDVTPGEGSGVMPLRDPELNLGMLICFEDLLPGLSRDRIGEGADVFVNQTNDAWFDPLWGSRAHLANAVFRSVEQRRPMVRATNSGMSAWIDTRGIVREVIEDPVSGEQKIREAEVFDVEIPILQKTTFYFKWPWLFPVVCWGMGFLLFHRELLPAGKPFRIPGREQK